MSRVKVGQSGKGDLPSIGFFCGLNCPTHWKKRELQPLQACAEKTGETDRSQGNPQETFGQG